jgi:hypothetical protein
MNGYPQKSVITDFVVFGKHVSGKFVILIMLVCVLLNVTVWKDRFSSDQREVSLLGQNEISKRKSRISDKYHLLRLCAVVSIKSGNRCGWTCEETAAQPRPSSQSGIPEEDRAVTIRRTREEKLVNAIHLKLPERQTSPSAIHSGLLRPVNVKFS